MRHEGTDLPTDLPRPEGISGGVRTHDRTGPVRGVHEGRIADDLGLGRTGWVRAGVAARAHGAQRGRVGIGVGGGVRGRHPEAASGSRKAYHTRPREQWIHVVRDARGSRCERYRHLPHGGVSQGVVPRAPALLRHRGDPRRACAARRDRDVRRTGHIEHIEHQRGSHGAACDDHQRADPHAYVGAYVVRRGVAT